MSSPSFSINLIPGEEFDYLPTGVIWGSGNVKYYKKGTFLGSLQSCPGYEYFLVFETTNYWKNNEKIIAAYQPRLTQHGNRIDINLELAFQGEDINLAILNYRSNIKFEWKKNYTEEGEPEECDLPKISEDL